MFFADTEVFKTSCVSVLCFSFILAYGTGWLVFKMCFIQFEKSCIDTIGGRERLREVQL